MVRAGTTKSPGYEILLFGMDLQNAFCIFNLACKMYCTFCNEFCVGADRKKMRTMAAGFKFRYQVKNINAVFFSVV